MHLRARVGSKVREDALTLPNFLLIGAMRSGSSALASYLRPHPQIFMAERKEVHFFDSNFERGVGWYARWFEDSEGATAVGEATPTYLYDEDCPPRMAEIVPQAKLVAILRDPVDRAYSHFWRNRSRGIEELGFAEAVDAEPRRLADGDLTTRREFSYIDRGRYVRQLRRVCEFFPRAALMIVLLEDMHARPAEVYAGVCEFLGVDASFRPGNLGEPAARHKEYRSKRLVSMYRRVPVRVERILRRVNARPMQYPPMDAQLRADLLAAFEEDNAALATWLGRDLGIWRR